MSKRSYMSAEKRRAHLLDTAAGILANEGWMGLTMQAVAREGGTSRQLVYEYFPSLKKLTAALINHLLGHLEERIEGLLAAGGASTAELVRGSVKPLLDLNEAQSTALGALLVEQKFAEPELNELMGKVRDRIIERWMRIYKDDYKDNPDADENLVRTVIMARINGTWAIICEAKAGRISADQAMKVIDIMSSRTSDLFN